MLSHSIKLSVRLRRRLRRAHPLVLAVFSYRHDAHLVPSLLQNLAPITDGWIGFDDRSSTEFYSSEPKRRQALIGRARELGAKWILAVDPDERIESGFAATIRSMTPENDAVIWGFHLRELYTPQSYRVDGIWGQKTQYRLFPLLDGQSFSKAELHGVWFPAGPEYKRRHSGLNIYHLKMISPQRRVARRDLYNRLDPDQRYQKLGYDYLAEEAGLALEVIPAGRMYLPCHVEDGGLWMPDARVSALDSASPKPRRKSRGAPAKKD